MPGKTNFTAVVPVRAYETIVDQIEEAIASGEMVPGDHLPGERDLMVSFGVSRATVREALRVLETTGLIRSRPGDPRGAEVLQVSPATLHKTMSRLVRVGSMDLSELVEFRIMLEETACALAARHRSADQLAEMKHAVDAMAAAIGSSPTAFGEADVAFHVTVWAASRNRLIQTCGLAVREALIDLVRERILQSEDANAQMQLSLAHDREIYRAIERGAGQEAATLSREFVLEYYGEVLERRDRGRPAADVGAAER